MNIKQKILRHLIENREKTFSINGIARALKIDYKLIYTNVQRLAKEETIKVEDFGNTKRCSFKDIFNEDVFIVETDRKNGLLKNKDFAVIYNWLGEINKQFILLLFGSHAKGTAIKHSDIDLLLISTEEDSRIIQNKIDLIPVNIHLTPVSYEGFIGMLKSKEFTVVSEAIKNNIILFGLEDYYRFIANSKKP